MLDGHCPIEIRVNRLGRKVGQRNENNTVDQDDSRHLGIERNAEHRERQQQLGDTRCYRVQAELDDDIERPCPFRLGRLDLRGIVLDEECAGLPDEALEETRAGHEIEAFRAHCRQIAHRVLQRQRDAHQQGVQDQAR